MVAYWLWMSQKVFKNLVVVLLTLNKSKINSHFAVNSWAWLLLRCLIEPFLSVKISSYLSFSYLCSYFWGNSFKMHFLMKQFWSVPLFSKASFEAAVMTCTHVLKCIFWESNFEVYLFSEMHFLREWISWFSDSWLLISPAAVLFCFTLCFLLKSFTTGKTFSVLTCINKTLGSEWNGCKEVKHVSRGTCFEWLPPLGKSSASLGKGWVGSTVKGR